VTEYPDRPPDRPPDRQHDRQHDWQHDWLRPQVTAAIRELEAMRCPDPAAIDAFLTARLALHTLRELWLPHL
jgi:hypothetical protein